MSWASSSWALVEDSIIVRQSRWKSLKKLRTNSAGGWIHLRSVLFSWMVDTQTVMLSIVSGSFNLESIFAGNALPNSQFVFWDSYKIKAHCSFITTRANGKKIFIGISLASSLWFLVEDRIIVSQLRWKSFKKMLTNSAGECNILITCRLPGWLTETVVQNIASRNFDLESIFAGCAFPNWFVFREPLLF